MSRYRVFLLVLAFLQESCHAYHVSTGKRKFFLTDQTAVVQSDHNPVSTNNRRAFVGAVLAIMASTSNSLPSRAVDVVLPGEMKPQEPRNRRLGGLASKIRTVGKIMVRASLRTCTNTPFYRATHIYLIYSAVVTG